MDTTEKGIEGLYVHKYHRKGSQMEVHKTTIIEDFNKHPVCSIAQAITSIRELTGIERKPTQVRATAHLLLNLLCRLAKTKMAFSKVAV
jgi:uncharacterized protein YxjI